MKHRIIYLNLLSLICIMSAFLLSACATAPETGGGSSQLHKTHYQYTPPVSTRGKQCVAACHREAQQCKNVHRTEYEQCLQSHRGQAATQFEAYRQAQIAENAPVTKTLANFMSNNDTASCALKGKCGDDFRICYELCGGKIS